jgi:hypothetical protein
MGGIGVATVKLGCRRYRRNLKTGFEGWEKISKGRVNSKFNSVVVAALNYHWISKHNVRRGTTWRASLMPVLRPPRPS